MEETSKLEKIAREIPNLIKQRGLHLTRKDNTHAFDYGLQHGIFTYEQVNQAEEQYCAALGAEESAHDGSWVNG